MHFLPAFHHLCKYIYSSGSIMYHILAEDIMYHIKLLYPQSFQRFHLF